MARIEQDMPMVMANAATAIFLYAPENRTARNLRWSWRSGNLGSASRATARAAIGLRGVDAG
jgi:hypothetical protein